MRMLIQYLIHVMSFLMLPIRTNTVSSCTVKDDAIRCNFWKCPFRSISVQTTNSFTLCLFKNKKFQGSITILCINSCRRAVCLDFLGHMKDELKILSRWFSFKNIFSVLRGLAITGVLMNKSHLSFLFEESFNTVRCLGSVNLL